MVKHRYGSFVGLICVEASGIYPRVLVMLYELGVCARVSVNALCVKEGFVARP